MTLQLKAGSLLESQNLKLKNFSSKEVENVCANTMYFIAIPGI